jgi:hypothetical protein
MIIGELRFAGNRTQPRAHVRSGTPPLGAPISESAIYKAQSAAFVALAYQRSIGCALKRRFAL